jgi:hypothetical protein
MTPLRHPGESRDPFCSGDAKSKWVPGFAGTTAWSAAQ